MQLHIRHETRYRYERPVKYSVQSLHLTPRRDRASARWPGASPAPGRRLEQVDAYGNISHLLTIEEPHREIQIVVRGVVETADTEAGRTTARSRRSPTSRPPCSPRRTMTCALSRARRWTA
jgi:transglutaminase-like putative cysteine protease